LLDVVGVEGRVATGAKWFGLLLGFSFLWEGFGVW
jgi:hypothetical protein